MKKMISLLLCILFVISLCACSKSNSDIDNETAKADNDTSSVMQTVLNSTEYVLYQNVFYNGNGSDYEGQTVTKEGIFSALIDEFNNMTRYYIWGYNDQTKCCDYQWELNISNTDSLPNNGSLVEVSGTFTSSDASLDGYWIENPTITVISDYKGVDCDIDMTTMDATLERVQIINMQSFPDAFEGKTVCAYGRIETPTSIQHPYYESQFSQPFESNDTIPPTGTVVIVKGTYSNGTIIDSSVEATDLF